MSTDYPQVEARSRQIWRAWLRRNHRKAPGVWLVFPKKATGLPTVSYNDAVEEALCFGWIDGLMNPIDATWYKQLFTPRKPRSAWAASNKARVARLIDQGLMTTAGLAAIATAKANGSWERLSEADALKVPPSLKKAIDANARAKKNWPVLTDSQRKTFLFHLANARRDETRAKRIGQIVELVASRATPSLESAARRKQRLKASD